MSTINRLSSVDALQPGDLIPVWDGSNGDTRKASMSTLLAYIESNFADPDYTTRVVAPSANGFNVDAGDTGTSLWLIINPLAAYASGSISLPAAAFAANDQEVVIVFTQSVASFSITSAGATIENSPTFVNTYDSFRFRYNASQLTWYRLDSAAITADLVAYLPAGTGAVVSTVQTKLRESVSVKDFGAIGDGVTDDTAALVLAFAALADGQELFFPSGDYLVSYQGTPYASVNGYVVGNLIGLSDIIIRGVNARIVCVNHNITTYGGLMFLWMQACHNVRVEGLYFDMTFTGVNTSGSFYPFVGAIICSDGTATGAKVQSALNQNITVRDCSFKIFHPYGCVASTSAPYLGDPNNGFKSESIFFSGDYLAQDYANQNRGFYVDNCRWLDGHNAYGIWGWGVNDMMVTRCSTESWVTKGSNTLGVLLAAIIPFIRYHQWYCQGLTISDNYHRAKPSAERLVAGFEGCGSFANINSGNESVDIELGSTIITGNHIRLGRGDAASGNITDYGIDLHNQGMITIANNTFASSERGEITNASSETGIFWNSSSNYSLGDASLTIMGNHWSEGCDYMSNIVIANSYASSAVGRRLKNLIVSNNTSMGQLQQFLRITSGLTYYGVENVLISGNIVNGTGNAVWDKNSTNSRAFEMACSETTDLISMTDNVVIDSYYLVYSDGGIAGTYTNSNMTSSGITVDYLGAVPLVHMRGTGSPEGIEFGAIGSTFNRTDGGVGASLYVKESSPTLKTGWVAVGTTTGTFTCVLSDAVTGGNLATFATSTGKYTKIGNKVFCQMSMINIDTTGMTAGNGLFIQGLPFTSDGTANFQCPASFFRSSITATESMMLGLIDTGATTMGLVNSVAATAGFTAALVSQINSGSGDLRTEFSYFV
jgi:hypothetical protein